jgi:hypothetical protein
MNKWPERIALLCLVCFLTGGLSWMLVREAWTTEIVPQAGMYGMAEPWELTGLGIASPNLSPHSVVQLQIASMQAARSSPAAIRVCFELASPGNRELTGPLERFAEMVNMSPYNQIGAAAHWQAGRSVLEGKYAAIFVTTIAQDGTLAAFRFLLEKQSQPPHENCWMTVAVEFVEIASENSVITHS